jgi:hypothetical protein
MAEEIGIAAKDVSLVLWDPRRMSYGQASRTTATGYCGRGAPVPGWLQEVQKEVTMRSRAAKGILDDAGVDCVSIPR